MHGGRGVCQWCARSSPVETRQNPRPRTTTTVAITDIIDINSNTNSNCNSGGNNNNNNSHGNNNNNDDDRDGDFNGIGGRINEDESDGKRSGYENVPPLSNDNNNERSVRECVSTVTCRRVTKRASTITSTITTTTTTTTRTTTTTTALSSLRDLVDSDSVVRVAYSDIAALPPRRCRRLRLISYRCGRQARIKQHEDHSRARGAATTVTDGYFCPAHTSSTTATTATTATATAAAAFCYYFAAVLLTLRTGRVHCGALAGVSAGSTSTPRTPPCILHLLRYHLFLLLLLRPSGCSLTRGCSAGVGGAVAA